MLEIDDTIDRVGKLYHAVTGREPPAADAPYAAIPAEKDPVQYIEEQVDKLLLALSTPGAAQATRGGPWMPRVAVFESSSEVAVCIDLPGVAREHVTVNVGNGVLVISGHRTTALQNGHVLRVAESPLGSFRRMVPIPPGLRVDETSALMKDGVLEVRIPRDGHRPAHATRHVPVA